MLISLACYAAAHAVWLERIEAGGLLMSAIEPAQPAAAIVPATGDGRALTVVKPSPRIVEFTPKPPPAPPSKRPRFLRAHGARRRHRPLAARLPRPLHRGPLAGGARRSLFRLGDPSRAMRPGKRFQLVDKAARKSVPLCELRRPLRVPRPAGRVHRAVAAGPALRRRRTGISGRSTSSTRRSCSISNGGTTRPPAFAASRSSTSGWWSSCRGRSST